MGLLETYNIEVATNHKRSQRMPLNGDTNTVDIEGRKGKTRHHNSRKEEGGQTSLTTAWTPESETPTHPAGHRMENRFAGHGGA